MTSHTPSRPPSRLEEILDALDGQAEGTEREALLREAIELPEAVRNTGLGTALRLDLIRLVRAGHPEEVLTLFNWCLSMIDAGGLVRERTMDRLMWEYKAIARTAPEFTAFSAEQIDGLFADMSARYEKLGKGLRAVYGCRCQVAAMMGRHDEAARLEKLWFETPRDDASDCEACEVDNRVEVLLAADRPPEALRAAAPLLAGTMKCSEVPGITHCQLLVPLVRMGNVGQAEKYRQASKGVFAEFSVRLRCAADHLAYLALSRQHAAAGAWATTYLAEALAHRSDFQRFRFLAALRLWALVAQLRGERSMPLAAPAGAGLTPDPDPATLQAWVTPRCAEIAAAFDRRNGNAAFTDALAAQPEIAGQNRGRSFWSRLFGG